MQSIATYTEEEIEQIRQVQRIIRTGTRKELAEYMASVRAGYTTPEYLKQQTMQMQELHPQQSQQTKSRKHSG